MNAQDPSSGYAVTDATAVLADAGLLREVLLPGPAGLSSHAPADALGCVSGAFAGAGLDSRTLRPGELFVALPGEHVHGRQFAPERLTVGGWVLTDAVAAPDPLLGLATAPGSGVLISDQPEAALAALATAWRRRLNPRLVGVTGTNGKTTTKDYLAALLTGAGPTHATAGNHNNFLGLPLTLLGLRPEHRFGVIEMGASAVGEIDVLAGLTRPDVGVITNASPAHLEQFGSLAGIITGKGELLDHLPPDGAAVLNVDSPGWTEWRDRAPCRVVSFGRQAGDHRWAWTNRAAGPGLDLDGVFWPTPLPGEHNACNLAAAILAAREAGAGEDEIRAGLEGFQGSAHRGVLLQIAGRTVLDDAYNANPTSMRAAVHTLVELAAGGAGRSIAVLGHMAELGAEAAEIHHQTGHALADSGLNVLLAVGPTAAPLREGFDAGGGEAHYCAAIDAAAAWLNTRSAAGDFILIKGSRSAAMERILDLMPVATGDDHRTQD